MTVGGAKPWPTLAVVALGGLAAVGGLGLLLEFFAFLATHHWWPWNDRTPVPADVPRNATAAGAGIAVAIAGAIAYTRQRTDEQSLALERAREERTAEEASTNLQLERDRDDRSNIEALRTRYTTAAAQLGDISAAIRLAGVYAMAALADDWLGRENRHEAQTCINVLCAYLRADTHPTTTDVSDRPSYAEDEVLHRGEIEVRQTVVAVITSRLQPGATKRWEGFRFDFTGAAFNAGDFNFAFARFSGGRVSFDDAWFGGGSVNFTGSTFSDTYLSFAGARFRGGSVRFSAAEFSDRSNTSFGNAEFYAGTVSFEGVRFHGRRVIFDGASFSGARVSFEHAEFSSGQVMFSEAAFTNGSVSFDQTMFLAGRVSFDRATFSDNGELTFDQAQLDGGELRGPWGSAAPPLFWPTSAEDQ